ncbi:phosphoribosylformylglycinamidin [Auricularia subglabra TFB-10046 SS5]|nr:phosphoribosylformylglycinamidin [Auricularia subglabra TFB-10046 SS5]
MLVLAGPRVLSDSKLAVLLKDVKKTLSRVTGIQAQYVHVVHPASQQADDLLRQTDSSERVTLDALLTYGDPVPAADASVHCTIHIFPRPGSISPWSSKATDIARICNLGSAVSRLERGVIFKIATVDGTAVTQEELSAISHSLHDRMTQSIYLSQPGEDTHSVEPRPLRTVQLHDASDAHGKLVEANRTLGLALSTDEIAYLVDAFVTGPTPIGRDPTDAELFMFAQVNSEHCRHKIFNADWTIDGVKQPSSLFGMIRNTERSIQSAHTISAYSDNAAVLEGNVAPRFSAAGDGLYSAAEEDMPILVKVETHNHPTAVSPYPGAATGSGGEIRDEGAVGRGSKPKAGLTGFSVSNLRIPAFEQEWERSNDVGYPSHIASSLDIMIEAPLGAAAFNNEFGRPALAGYFRTFTESSPDGAVWGYHKPIMLAGGLGNVRPQFAKKAPISPGAKLVVLGGPGLLIGLGGGAASSQAAGASSAELDFASVQRDNAEMQRRCQQVIDACVSRAEGNPVESIHDVGAGGLSNALPELVHDSSLGARIEIRDVLVDDHSMSPMEIWCNESQERYVLAVSASSLSAFESIAQRERAPFAVVGEATKEQKLVVTDRLLGPNVVDLQMSTLFGKPPKMSRTDSAAPIERITFDTGLSKYLPVSVSLADRVATAARRVLRLPSVGSKSFLITIGDRSISGLVTRDQMVGPWQVPVADVAVTRASYGFVVRAGEAMALGERTPVALLDAAASARMAVGEALTNLAAARVPSLSRVKLSANWMCAAGRAGQGAALYAAVRAVGEELCPALGVGIPVGKDSMSMAMRWTDDGDKKEVTAPLSLIVTAFAPVDDVAKTWTPVLRSDIKDTVLVFVDLSHGRARLGGSALAQVFNTLGEAPADVDDPAGLKAFFNACQDLKVKQPNVVLAYHDRSDGGLFATLAEMCFAGRVGAEISLDALPGAVADPVATLFNEELGAVLQVRRDDLTHLVSAFAHFGFPTSSLHTIGTLTADESFVINCAAEVLFSSTRAELQLLWAETSFRMQSIRDDLDTSREEYALVSDPANTGLSYHLTYQPEPTLPREVSAIRPRVAILREQGVNGHVEMAWAFTAAGFDAVDVHMSDILAGRTQLANFRGLAACGGFSYGDVLGAGAGWAKSVLFNERARGEFERFFARADAFALGVCNGCQFFSHLRGLIPGAQNWPLFGANRSGRFEARICTLSVDNGSVTSQSVFLRGMGGSCIPVAVAHGEGRASFADDGAYQSLVSQGGTAVRYVDSSGQPTQTYPLNPNGSPGAIAGVQSPDGRILALMPHPERVVALESNSWYPPIECARRGRLVACPSQPAGYRANRLELALPCSRPCGRYERPGPSRAGVHADLGAGHVFRAPFALAVEGVAIAPVQAAGRLFLRGPLRVQDSIHRIQAHPHDNARDVQG